MSDQHIIPIRLSPELLARIDRVRDDVQHEREFLLKPNITRSDLIRYLLLRAIESIENSPKSTPPPTS